MCKKVEWNLMDYNHKIFAVHYENCLLCKEEHITYCIVCGKHIHVLRMCYWCGDVVCQTCCPIPLAEHNQIFVANEKGDI